MPTTEPLAYKAMTDTLQAAWPGTVSIVDPVPELRFEDIEQPGIPRGYFARFAMRPAAEPQSTIRNGQDKRYTAAGLIFVQLFGPREDRTAKEKLRLLGQFLKDTFRPGIDDGCIIMRNLRVVRLEPEQDYIRANFIAEYEYDEIG